MRFQTIVLCFCLILCSSALSQERGIIRCDPGSGDHIPAWTAPGSSHVVEQLSCGQTVSIAGLERGYLLIQIGEQHGYVNAKYVQIVQTPDQRIAELEKQVKTLQEQTVRPASAPTTSRRDLAAFQPGSDDGYQPPARFDVGGMFTWIRAFETGDDSDFFGWNVVFTGNLTKHFGLEANVSGNYWNSPVSIVGGSFHGLAGGPRISFPGDRVTPFFHFLVGFVHAKQNVLGLSFSDGNFLTLMPGFGMDVNLNRRFAIRAFQADYPVLRGQGAWSYKNMRIGSGFVTRF